MASQNPQHHKRTLRSQGQGSEVIRRPCTSLTVDECCKILPTKLCKKNGQYAKSGNLCANTMDDSPELSAINYFLTQSQRSDIAECRQPRDQVQHNPHNRGNAGPAVSAAASVRPLPVQPPQSYHPKPVPVPLIPLTPSVRPLPVQPQQYQPQQYYQPQPARSQPARQPAAASSSAACSTLPTGLAPRPPSEKESNVLSDAFIASLNFGLRLTQATASAVASATRASYNYVSGDSPEQRAARQQNARNQAYARKIHNSIAREESSHWAYRWTLGMGVHGAAWTLSCAKGAISRQWGVEKARWDLANANVDLEYAQRMNQRILEYISRTHLSQAIEANLMRILDQRYNVDGARATVTELQRIHTEAVAAATAAAKTAADVAALTAAAAATDAADKKRIRQLQAAAESIGQVALRVRNDASRERVRAYVEAQRPLMHLLMTNSRAINAQRGSDAEQILLEAARAVDAEMEPAQENLCAQMNQLVSEARAIKLDDAKMSKSIEKLEQSLEASSNAIAGAAQAAQTVKLLRTVSGEISERVHAVLEENLQTVHSEDSLRREELRMLESIATTPMGDLHSEEQHRLISASITRRRQQLIAEYKDMLENIEMSAEDQQELQRLLQELQEANEEDRVRFQEAERRRNAAARETPDEDDEKEPGTPDNTRKGGYSLEKGKLYDRKGRLLYSGELVDGVPHGKGTAYDVESGKGYKAKFKGGKML